MATAIFVPRLNSNDDGVRVTRIRAYAGDAVRAGDVIAELATDKAVFTVESEQDGCVVEICAGEGDQVEVGAVLAWIGANAAEAVGHAACGSGVEKPEHSGAATLKARMLMARNGLAPHEVAGSGTRVSAADVERHVQAAGNSGRGNFATVRPSAGGRLVALSPYERGMLRTVESPGGGGPVPGYIEMRYDAGPWRTFADRFREEHQLLLDPLLALMAWKLAQIARERESLNATLMDGQRYIYDDVNLGYAVESRSALYLVVARQADRMSALQFSTHLAELQVRAMGDCLAPEEVTGATVAFSSMSRWGVERHVPVLPRFTSLIVAQAGGGGEGVIGATFDHRLLTGGDVAVALQALRDPPVWN